MIFKSIRIKIREILNPIIGPIRRDVLVNKGAILPFTIISNNCWGGHVYRFFAESYASPTIGMYFFTPDYIKLLNNLEYYFNLPLDFITYKESKYKNKLEEYGGDNLSCPIGKLDDIECIFLHYSTQQEAKDKWERRKKRINWDNLYVKMSEQNLCTEEHLKAFDLLPYKNKFVFVHKDYNLESQIICKNEKPKGYVTDDTSHFHKYINLYEWLSKNH